MVSPSYNAGNLTNPAISSTVKVVVHFFNELGVLSSNKLSGITS